MNAAAHYLHIVRDIFSADLNHSCDDPFGVVVLSSASRDELCRRFAPMNTIASSRHLGDFIIHIGTECIEVCAVDLSLMQELVRRKENIALGVIIKSNRDILMGINKLFDRLRFRLTERCFPSIDIGAGIGAFGPPDRKVPVEIDTDRSVMIDPAVFSPEGVVLARILEAVRIEAWHHIDRRLFKAFLQLRIDVLVFSDIFDKLQC